MTLAPLLPRSRNHEEITSATARTGNKITCLFPLWRSAAEPTNITLLKGGIGVPFAGGDAGFRFDVFPVWDAVSAPSQPLSSFGGFPITVSGAGFSPGGGYACRFSTGYGQLSAAAVALSLTQISCRVPAWGGSFPGGWTQLEILDGKGSSITPARACPDGGDALCSLELRTYTASVSPGNASSLGGEKLNVSGGGFDAARPLYCVFGGPPPLPFVATAAVVKSTTGAECITPHWVHGARTLPLFLSFAPGPPQGGPLGSAPVALRAAWSNRTVSHGPASGGGTPILIRGAGFFGLSLRCGFTGIITGGYAESVGDAVGDAEFACVPPRWERTAETTEISVYAMAPGGTRIAVAYEGGDAEMRMYTFTEGWISASPTLGPAVGGGPVSISGHGFGPASEYKCVFARGGDAESSDAIHVVGTTTSSQGIDCPPPPWGLFHDDSYAPSGFGNGSASPPALRAPANLSLYRLGARVNRTGGDALFGFYAAWRSMSWGAPLGVSALGGMLITISGGGFAVGANFSCRWGDAESPLGGYAVFSPGEPVSRTSVSEVRCLFPVWDAPKFRARLTLLSGGAVVPYVGDAGGDALPITAFLSSVYPSHAPAKGGSIVTLNGNGFPPEAQCIFSRPGRLDAISTGSAISSSPTSVLCGVPPWGHAASGGDAQLTLRHPNVGIAGSPLDFRFLSGWSEHTLAWTGASGFGGKFDITAYGLAEGDAELLQCGVGVVRMDASIEDDGRVTCASACWGCVLEAGPHAVTLWLNTTKLAYTGAAGYDRLSIVEAVGSASPSFGLGYGGVPITITGAAFSAGSAYLCRFSASPSRVAFSPLNATVLGPTAVLCWTPLWPGATQLTEATLVTFSGRAAVVGSAPFKFEDAWSNFSPRRGPIRGGTLVTFAGGGFVGPYRCHFGPASVQANVASPTAVVCEAPRAPGGPSASVQVMITDSAGRALPGGGFTWGYHAGWDGLAPGSPSRGPASGGTLITLSGYGLGSGRGYRCIFVSATGQEMAADHTYVVRGTGVIYGSPQADWTVTTRVEAVTPLWGDAFAWGMVRHAGLERRLKP